MNSVDAKFRDERDIAELLEIANDATVSLLVALLAQIPPPADIGIPELRARYESLVARRLAEDAGGVVK